VPSQTCVILLAEAREVAGSEKARVHHAARRRDGVAVRGAGAAVPVAVMAVAKLNGGKDVSPFNVGFVIFPGAHGFLMAASRPNAGNTRVEQMASSSAVT
jgi:hypothetical protein